MSIVQEVNNVNKIYRDLHPVLLGAEIPPPAANRIHSQRTAIAIPTFEKASGQLIGAPPSAVLVAASRTRRSLTTIKCRRSTPRIPLVPVLPYTRCALNKLKSNHLERAFVHYSLSNHPELPESCQLKLLSSNA